MERIRTLEFEEIMVVINWLNRSTSRQLTLECPRVIYMFQPTRESQDPCVDHRIGEVRVWTGFV